MQTNPAASLGIDIAKQSFTAALLVDMQLVTEGEFSNDLKGYKALCTWFSKALKSAPGYHLHVCMEATGTYADALAEYLTVYFAEHRPKRSPEPCAHAPHLVSMVNPSLPRAYGKSRMLRNKTDKMDAENIAHYCATQHPKPWQPPTAQQRTLKDLTRHRESLKQNLTQERNRQQAGVSSPAVRKQIKEHIDFLNQQVRELDKEIADLLKQTQQFAEDAALLITIPGVGYTTVATFLAEVPNIHNFNTAAQLVAYAGLNPSHTKSGTSVKRKGHISKKGNKHLRNAFYMPTLSAIQFNPILKAIADRFAAQGRPPMVAVIAGMRKLLQLMFGILKTRTPFDPNHVFLLEGA